MSYFLIYHKNTEKYVNTPNYQGFGFAEDEEDFFDVNILTLQVLEKHMNKHIQHISLSFNLSNDISFYCWRNLTGVMMFSQTNYYWIPINVLKKLSLNQNKRIAHISCKMSRVNLHVMFAMMILKKVCHWFAHAYFVWNARKSILKSKFCKAQMKSNVWIMN